MRNYLIPANSKKSMLIFGLFNTADLIIFCTGVGVTLLLLMIIPVDQLPMAIMAITPGLVCGFLVLPVPNYHNMRTVINSIYTFYTSRQKFLWKGWCFLDGETDEK